MIFNMSTGGASTADKVKYNNTDSGLQSTDVQGAIDEVNSSLNSINSNLSNVIVDICLGLLGQEAIKIFNIPEKYIGRIYVSSYLVKDNSSFPLNIGKYYDNQYFNSVDYNGSTLTINRIDKLAFGDWNLHVLLANPQKLNK